MHENANTFDVEFAQKDSLKCTLNVHLMQVDEEWNLLIQLDSSSVPFSINFGDAGVGYGFIRAD